MQSYPELDNEIIEQLAFSDLMRKLHPVESEVLRITAAEISDLHLKMNDLPSKRLFQRYHHTRNTTLGTLHAKIQISIATYRFYCSMLPI